MGPETLIDAIVEKEEKIYNNLGEYVTTKKYKMTDTAYIGISDDSLSTGGSCSSSSSG